MKSEDRENLKNQAIKEIEEELGLVQPTKLESILTMIALILLLVIVVSVITGLWGYNPTSVTYLNWKVAGTAGVLLVVDIIILRNTD